MNLQNADFSVCQNAHIQGMPKRELDIRAVRNRSCGKTKVAEAIKQKEAQETSKAFQSSYGSKVPAHLMNAMLKMWVESFLPKRCVKTLEVGGPFNPSSHNVHVGPLGTVGGPSTVFTTSIKEDVGVAKHKRSVAALEDKTPHVRSKRFISALSSMFPGMSMGMPRGRGGAQKEVSESAQMMKTLLMFSKMQKRRAMQNVKRTTNGRKVYSGDKYNFGSGLYGDTYPGKRKRRSVDNAHTETDVVQPSEPLSRKKRFLFGDAPDVPSAGPPMPSFMSILMGTARDPNTGKKVEFGGDYMKNMMRRSFMSAMPHLAGNTPPGKEPPDVVKNLAPLWYFSRMQRAMRPRPAPMMDGYESYSMMRRASPGSIKSRNRDGYYGDSFPGLGKRKRRSIDNLDAETETANKRVKRQSGEGGNDVITIGDVSIPTDFFKPPERSEEPKYYGGYRKPDDARYYHQYSAPQQHYYHQPQPSRYHQQQQYYRQQLQRQKLQQQQQQQKFYQHYKHLYSLYLQAVGRKPAPPTRNDWTPAAPQVPYAPPPAQQAPLTYNPPAYAQAQTPQAPTSSHNNYAPPPPAAQAPPHNSFHPFPPQQPQMPMQQPGLFSPPQSSNQFFGQPQAPLHFPHAPPPHQSYPVDPFIPNPPLPPLAVTTPLPSRKRRSANLIDLTTLTDLDASWGSNLHRHKRSDDSDKDRSRYNNFFFPQPMFPTTLFSSYFPPRYTTYSNKIGYRQPGGGGVIYGDRLPWTSSWTPPQTKARLAPPGRQPQLPSAQVSRPSPPPLTKGIRQSPVPPAQVNQQAPPSPAQVSRQPPPPPTLFSPSAPVNQSPLQPSAPVNQNPPPSSGIFSPSAPVNPHPMGVSTRRRVKRSDNKDNPDSSPNFLFSPSFFTPFLSPAQNHHNKMGFATGRGGVIYGDHMPWARRIPAAVPYFSNGPAAAAAGPSPTRATSFGGPLDQYFSTHAQSWGQRG
ncbi:hypothetical protein ElyMa_002073800 [Elysia marginata]|uniref:Uncharacterized protein n=1 Tax=Elysia marginata TaxID=1093978 RepID=A0AAV4FCV7_9GAST|nr:hypothetical protein ElyMa_002073800 [Elysia marginata]